jgi:hypothetical protein
LHKNEKWGEIAYLDDGGILLASLLELFVVQLGVLVQIHLPEQLVHSLYKWNKSPISFGANQPVEYDDDLPSQEYPHLREA